MFGGWRGGWIVCWLGSCGFGIFVVMLGLVFGLRTLAIRRIRNHTHTQREERQGGEEKGRSTDGKGGEGGRGGEGTLALSCIRSATSFNPTKSPINPPISITYPTTPLHISSTASVSHPPVPPVPPVSPLPPVPPVPPGPPPVFGSSVALAMPWRYVMRRVDGVGSGE